MAFANNNKKDRQFYERCNKYAISNNISAEIITEVQAVLLFNSEATFEIIQMIHCTNYPQGFINN